MIVHFIILYTIAMVHTYKEIDNVKHLTQTTSFKSLHNKKVGPITISPFRDYRSTS